MSSWLSQSRLLALTTSAALHSFHYTASLSHLILVRLRFLSLAGVLCGYPSGLFDRFDDTIESITHFESFVHVVSENPLPLRQRIAAQRVRTVLEIGCAQETGLGL